MRRLRRAGRTDRLRNPGLRELDLEILDHWIRQQGRCDVGSDLARVIGAVIDLEFEVLALPDLTDLLEPQARQCPSNRLPLRVENLRLQHHIDDNFRHHARLVGRLQCDLTGHSWSRYKDRWYAENVSPVSVSYAST